MSEISLLFLAALARLDEDDREIVIDRCICGVSLNGLADRFGVSKTTIQNRERKALAALRGHLFDLGFVR